VAGQIPIQPGNIPLELRSRNQWVCWRSEADGRRRTKVPYQVSGAKASVTQPPTWTTFSAALSATLSGAFDGIGYVLTTDDPYTCADLDHVRDPDTGVLTAAATGIIEMLATYAEISPSGTGIHVWAKARKPGGRCRTGDIEIYDRCRFIAITGAHVPQTATVIEERQTVLDTLYTEIFPSGPPPKPATTGPQRVRLDDAALLRRMFESRAGARIRRLWEGDRSGYKSASEADAALCADLAYWAGHDKARIDRLFRDSGLYREKWDERRGDSTYGAITIAAVLAKNSGAIARPSSASTAEDRFASLVETGDGVPLVFALRHRRDLGLTHGMFTALLGLLTHYRVPGQWRSFPQELLARQQGIERAGLNVQVTRLRDIGHVAARADLRFRPKRGLDATLFYCCDPYIACLGMRAAQDLGEADADRAQRMRAEAEERLGTFLGNVDGGLGWRWRFGPLDTARGATAVDVANAYTNRFGVSFEATPG